MRVLFIHNTVPEYRVAFFTELSKLVDLDILVTEPNLAQSIYKVSYCLPKSLKIKTLNKTSTLSSIIRNEQYDIVVLPPIDNRWQLQCAYKALRICQLYRIRTVYWTEKWEAERQKQPFGKKVKNFIQAKAISYFAKRCDLCIAAGTKSKQYYLDNKIALDKICIAFDSSTSPAVIAPVKIRENYRISSDGKIILFMGRLIKRKGCEILIDSFKKMVCLNEKLYLLICGDGEELQILQSKVKRESIKNVIFAGAISPNIRSAYYEASDVFVLPSYSLNGTIEAWGLTINEALECGLPVVVSDAVGAAYDLSDGKCCIMIHENDSESIRIAINKILSEKDLSEYCKQRYSFFSVKNMAKSFYESFLTI